MDDVGIDQMRVFGYSADDQPRTPNIDAIAQAGVRFRNGWPMHECSPSRVAFFTGRYPLRTGVVTFIQDEDLAQSQASPFEVTTPQVLRTRGYKSALFGKWHLTGLPQNNPLGNATPSAMGWDFFYGDLEAAPRALDTTAGGVAEQGTYTCGFVTDAAFGACRFSDGTCTDLGQPQPPRAPCPDEPAWNRVASWCRTRPAVRLGAPHRTSPPSTAIMWHRWTSTIPTAPSSSWPGSRMTGSPRNRPPTGAPANT
jgi:arylsulfatase A-like enzyme